MRSGLVVILFSVQNVKGGFIVVVVSLLSCREMSAEHVFVVIAQ